MHKGKGQQPPTINVWILIIVGNCDLSAMPNPKKATTGGTDLQVCRKAFLGRGS